MSAFNFGQPASTGTSSGSLFGTSSNTTGNLFGSTPSSTSTGFSFGAAPATTSGGEQKPIFGGVSGGFNFGKPAKDNTEPAKPLFGSAQPPATPGASGPSLFGNTTPATGQTFSFANPSTTPAGPPPSQAGLGASTGGSIFGSNNSAASAGSKPTFSFNQPAATTAASTSASTPATSAPSLFGGVQTGGLFGSKPADTAPASGSLFGSKTADKPADSAPKLGTAPSSMEPPKQAFNFGQPPAPAATTASASPNTTTPSLFTSTTGTTPAVTSGTLFSKPASADSTSKPLFNFPTVAAPSTSASAPGSSSTAPSKPLFGSLGSTTTSDGPSSAPLFGAITSSSSATTSATTTTATTTAPQAPLFSGFAPAASTPVTKPATAAPFSFAKPSSTASTQPSVSAPASTVPAPSASAPIPAPTTTSASTTAGAPALSATNTTTLGASTTGPAPPAQSRLRNKTMDEILTRWATDLTRYSKEFKSHAETIAHWDQIIVDNSQKIDKLYIKTRTCEKQTMSVEMQLAAVENQQNELESWLAKYENDVEEMLAKDGANQSELGGPDQERERTYKLAEKLGERLDDMNKDLESMVEEVNAANASLSKHTKSDEPITQIVRILNSHLTQLQVIDQGTAQLQNRVSAAQKAASGLNYLNGAANGDARAAVDDFYRSYMGRR